MSRAWQTLAIVCAIWAPQGEIDAGTYGLVALTLVSLWEVARHAKREQEAATRPRTVD